MRKEQFVVVQEEEEKVSENLRRGREIGASGEIPRAKS